MRHTWKGCGMRIQGVVPPSIDRSLLKYSQTNLLLPKPDGPLQTVFSSSSIVAVNRQPDGKTAGHRHPRVEHLKASLPRRRHGLENGPWSMV